ncbi:GNAT family N-acetyltransferase [Dethiothermospora halolimnae]|uniref:GNAT family N-acetyltransferase n=1 Tax=Dethiothermospora halolimnae TaxID=3114390 RepID=UPI003CCB75F1
MINYRQATKKDIKIVADFIGELNKKEENHIGYCGDNSDEILNSLKEDITDITFDKSFIIATDKKELIGVLGFDADIENGNSEIWGPFIKQSKWHIANEMWDKMTELLPKGIETISMFINIKNNNCLDLAKKLKFNKVSESKILEFNRSYLDNLDKEIINELTSKHYEDMKALHDRVFPNTYYSGKQIIDRINENRKLFAYIEDEKLMGYVYVEAEPDFGEGSIEFFAVDESERGKGIGYKLLNMALKWLYSFNFMEQIVLSVGVDNKKAISLYKKVGFKEKYQLCYLTKEI